MTATYEKPMILFESFELSQSVAENCGESAIGQTNHYSRETCGYKWGDLTIWVSEQTGCDIEEDVDAEVYAYCYNTPTPNMQVFSS